MDVGCRNEKPGQILEKVEYMKFSKCLKVMSEVGGDKSSFVVDLDC